MCVRLSVSVCACVSVRACVCLCVDDFMQNHECLSVC